MAELETTKDSTPAISGNFNYNYSKIDSISGVDIPDETKDCKSLLQLAAMAYNMSNKQTAYNKAAFEKYISVINKIVEQYDTKITGNESLLATHDSDIKTLKELVGNLDLEGTTSLMEATQQLVKVLFNDDNYQDGITTGSGNGIINDHETRICTLEADKVTYEYSAGDNETTHKIEITHPSGGNEDAESNKTDIYTAKAVDARIAAFKTELENNSSSVGSGSTTTGDKYIKGQVETTGITFTSTPITSDKPNSLMSESAIVETLNCLVNVLKDREITLKEMAENFGKFLATFQLEDAVVYNGALYCSRKIGNSDFWKAQAPLNGSITVVSDSSTTIGTKTYTFVKYTSTYAKNSLPFEVSAYIPNGTDSMADIIASGKLVPLGIFFGGNITWGELTADNGPYQSENVIYYVTDRKESYITNGTKNPYVFAKGEKGYQGPQGIGIRDVQGTNNTDSGAINTYTITLMDPANNNAEIENKPTFTVRNGYGFRYIGTLTTEHENELPDLGKNYTTSITSGWDSAPEGKSVQLNDYVVITDSFGNKIKVFNGTKWQEMIKGVTSSAIIPVYTKNSTSFTQIGHLRSAADYTTAKSKLLELAGNGNLYYTTDAFVTSNSSTQLAGDTLNNQATAIIINIG